MRASGVLLPIASLPSKYGIGSFSENAYKFIDQLKAGGQQYWQILPIGPTGFGDSPYQSFSTFAGNPYFIDLDQLIEDGLLTKRECEECDFGNDSRVINYEKVYLNRFPILRKAYKRSNCTSNPEFNMFVKENDFWLEDYALYMAIKDSYKGLSWIEWDKDIRLRKKEAIVEYRTKLSDDVEFYKFIQYVFLKHWNKLKKYANKNGIKIIGDIPIYVAFDSADTWANPELFQFDDKLEPIAVSGCPPDGFAKDGQLWGNPLYRWEVHKETGYEWWINRIEYSFIWYDVLRVDHFKGFDEYYSIPYGHETARSGQWKKGPGIDFFKTVQRRLGKLNIIAEDLGFITDSVKKLLKKTNFPGMKVIQFAFDSRDENESDYLPHNYEKNCIVYTGTHDNDTTKGWVENVSEDDLEYILAYLNKSKEDLKDIHLDMIRLAQASVANYCIIPIQDYLGLGTEARINVPSTVGTNWTWRLLEDEVTDELINDIRKITKLYGRI